MKIMKINNLKNFESKNIQQTNFTPKYSRALELPSQQLCEDVVENSNSVSFQGKKITKRMLTPMIKAGKSKKKIAAELGIGHKTLNIYLQRFGFLDCFRKVITDHPIIDRVALQKLADEGKTLNEMATALNTTVGIIRRSISEYGTARPVVDERALSRKYFSATTQKEKDAMYPEIDKILEEIAREEYKTDKILTFEDTLQDVRLRFCEIIAKKQKGSFKNIRNIFKTIRESKSISQKDISVIKLGYKPVKNFENDPAIMRFEENDYIKSCVKGSRLCERDEYVLEGICNENESFSDIAYRLGLTPERVKQILEKAINKVKRHRLLSSEEELVQQRIEFANKVVKDIIARDNKLKQKKHNIRY